MTGPAVTRTLPRSSLRPDLDQGAQYRADRANDSCHEGRCYRWFHDQLLCLLASLC